jgi:hypothetical protein
MHPGASGEIAFAVFFVIERAKHLARMSSSPAGVPGMDRARDNLAIVYVI